MPGENEMSEGGSYKMIDGKRVLVARTGWQPKAPEPKPKPAAKKTEEAK